MEPRALEQRAPHPAARSDPEAVPKRGGLALGQVGRPLGDVLVVHILLAVVAHHRRGGYLHLGERHLLAGGNAAGAEGARGDGRR